MMCTVHSLFHSYLYWLMVLVVSTRPNKFGPLSKENGGKQIEFIKMEVLLELKKCKRKFDLLFFPEKKCCYSEH